MSFKAEETVIVDLQFVYGNNFNRHVKELAIMKADSVTPSYYLFQPPYPLDELNDRAKRHENFIFENINGLSWMSGNTAYNNVQVILQEIKDYVIIVKGQQKMKYLSKFLGESNIINLDTKSSLISMKHYNHGCPTHPFDYRRCVLGNVFKILIFMEKENLLK
jgi:hypothetical protein